MHRLTSNTSKVSIIIPTFNSANCIKRCLKSINNQNYRNIEIIIVDNNSSDNIEQITDAYSAKFYSYGPDQTKSRVFGAPYQRNYGFKKASGRYVYYVDADMILSKGLISECVSLFSKDNKISGLIIPEESFGEGFWAKCKWLERRTYWGDNTIEAPRFFKKDYIRSLNYLDDKVGADDWDLAIRIKKNKGLIIRTKKIAYHDEGALTLKKLIRKRFLYGKDVLKFQQKHGTSTFFKYFSPFRRGYMKHITLLSRHPILTMGMIIMRICEYSGGAAGIIFSRIK